MLPEISRRCTSCGASIRERDALFCSECGKALPTSSKSFEESEQPPATTQPDEVANALPADEIVQAGSTDEPVNQANQSAVTKKDSQGEPAEKQMARSTDATKESQEEAPPVSATGKHQSPAPLNAGQPSQQIASRAHPRMEKTRETLHRASSVARGVIEDEVKRVEKIRHVSSVVIEEASYDPSLRFVLVALGLFVLFLILLVLSKVMG